MPFPPNPPQRAVAAPMTVFETVLTWAHAAVLIPLVTHDAGLTAIFTERTTHLNDHAGQVSFPGGRFEPADGGAVTTALREAEEEIGLAREAVEVVGRLDAAVQEVAGQLRPVADAQDGDAQVEDSGVNGGRAPVIDAGRSAGQDNA